MPNQKLLAQLRKRDNKAFIALYKGFPEVKQYILANSGTPQDAQDIFQEAVILLFRKVQSSDFQLTSTPTTYLFGICKFLWLNKLRKPSTSTADNVEEMAIPGLEEAIQEESKFANAETALKALGKKCQELLQLFYIKKLTMVDIAYHLKLRSPKVARNQKFKCMEQARAKYRKLNNSETIKTLEHELV